MLIFLHGAMAEDALCGLGDAAKDEKIRIATYARMDDSFSAHRDQACHRASRFQTEYECYGGRKCPFPGAEQAAARFLQEALELRDQGRNGEAEQRLGFAIHFVQDALCPEHILPFRTGFLGAHFKCALIVAVKYKRKNWPILVKNASLVPISNPDELKTKIEAEADHLRYNLRCSYTRQGIKPYVYEKQRGKLVVNILCGKPSFWKGWQMRDDDIGMWLEKTAGLIKGVYALFSAKTALS